MTSLCSTVFFLLALAAIGLLATPPTLQLWQGVFLNRVEGCEVGSLFCADDCKTVMLCTAGAPAPVETCGDDETCDATSLTCEPIGIGQCVLPSDVEFKCNSKGSFPDPFDCHSHHYCAELPNGTLVNLDYQCEEATAYDPVTTLCLLTEDDRVCREGPIPPCEVAGQTGPQQENPNIYYICVRDGSRVVPWLFRCPRDTEVFDGVACVPREPTTTDVPTTPTTTTSGPNTTEGTTLTTTIPWTTTPTTTTPTTTIPWTTTQSTTTPPTTTPTTTTPTTTTPTTTTPTTTTPTTTTPTTTTPTTTTPTTTTPTTTSGPTTSTPPFTTVPTTTGKMR